MQTFVCDFFDFFRQFIIFLRFIHGLDIKKTKSGGIVYLYSGEQRGRTRPPFKRVQSSSKHPSNESPPVETPGSFRVCLTNSRRSTTIILIYNTRFTTGGFDWRCKIVCGESRGACAAGGDPGERSVALRRCFWRAGRRLRCG